MPDYLETANGLAYPRPWATNGHAATWDEDEGYAPVRLSERLADLELSAEDAGWLREAAWNDRDFSRDGLKRILRLARLSFLKNPLIGRGVRVQAYYVWGQGVDIRAPNDDVNAVVQAFLDDAQNQAEIASHAARVAKEIELQVSGNLFFCFFTRPASGKVRIRSIPVDEVLAIVTNPDDQMEPWYYKREYVQSVLDTTNGAQTQNPVIAYYPDWRYDPPVKPPTIGDAIVHWDVPVHHVKVGGLRDMRFGVPEVYAALDWARAVKSDLEDYATTKRALSRFAWNMTTKGGAKGVANAKAKLQTTVGTSDPYVETNPPPVTASTFVSGEGTQLAPIRTAGSQPSTDDGRRLWLMVASALGLPECYSADTEVLTERGFMLHQDWQPGIKVACFDPDTGYCAWQHPASLSVHYYNGDMVHFRNQQTDILVTPNHRMWTARAVQWKLLNVSERASTTVSGRGGHQGVIGGESPSAYRSWHIETARYLIDHPRDAGWKVTGAVRFAEPDVRPLTDTPIGTVDSVAWARFLGYWIAEGSAAASVCKSGEFRKDGTPIMRTFRRVLLAQKPGQVLDEMRATLRRLGLHFGEHVASGGVVNLVIWNRALWGYLKRTCGAGSHSKRLPPAMLEAAADVRRALFEALMDGDGGWKEGSGRYSTASTQLADDVQRLAISLGYGASITIEKQPYRGEILPICRVLIRTHLTEVSHLKPKHVTTEPYSGTVYCFSVPTGIYVTRRNSKVAIQGNTFFGEASVGSHATAKTLDRPTELKMRDRQVLWADVLTDILQFVIDKDALAPGGTLKGALVVDADGRKSVDLGVDADGQPVDRTVEVNFPPMLERDALQRVGAVVQAITLNGFPSAGTLDKRTAVQLLLQALGEDDIDEMLGRLAPVDGVPLLAPVPPPAEPAHPSDGQVATSGSNDANRANPTQEKPSQESALMIEAVRELRAELRVLSRQGQRATAMHAPPATLVKKLVERDDAGQIISITERHEPVPTGEAD